MLPICYIIITELEVLITLVCLFLVPDPILVPLKIQLILWSELCNPKGHSNHSLRSNGSRFMPQGVVDIYDTLLMDSMSVVSCVYFIYKYILVLCPFMHVAWPSDRIYVRISSKNRGCECDRFTSYVSRHTNTSAWISVLVISVHRVRAFGSYLKKTRLQNMLFDTQIKYVR